MTDWISGILVNIFGNNVVLATVLISMVPIFELRGAIPIGVHELWGSVALNNWTAFGWSLLGSSLVVPIIALIFIPIINWLKKTKLFGKLATSIEQRIKNKAEGIGGAEEKSKKFSRAYWKKVLAVFVFVAIPLPLTGVWTGTCVAVFLGLDYLTTCTTVITGNVIAGLLIALILQFFPWLNNWLIWIFLGLLLVFIIIEIIKHFIKKNKTKNNTADEGK